MGSGLSLPCEHPGNAVPHYTIRGFLRSPAVAKLIDSVSDYFRNRTRKERKRASPGRNGHRRHTWPKNSPSAGWTDSNRNAPLSQPVETRFSLRDPRPVIYHSVFPTYDHRRGTYQPGSPFHHGTSLPRYRSSSQTYRCRDNLGSSPFDSDYVSGPTKQRRKRNSRHNQPARDCYDVPGPGLTDDDYFYESPTSPRRQRSRPHRQSRLQAELPSDRCQFRGCGSQRRHRVPIGARSGRSSYRTPSLSALSEEHHDVGASQDGSTEGFKGQGRRRERFVGGLGRDSAYTDLF